MKQKDWTIQSFPFIISSASKLVTFIAYCINRRSEHWLILAEQPTVILQKPLHATLAECYRDTNAYFSPSQPIIVTQHPFKLKLCKSLQDQETKKSYAAFYWLIYCYMTILGILKFNIGAVFPL